MKHIATLLVLLIAATAVSEEPTISEQQKAAMVQAAELRTFITTDGKEIAGRPTDFSKEANSVEIETADGSKRTVPLSTLSENDQAFIQDWLTGHTLFADNQIRFTIRKKTDPDKESKGDRSSWHEMFPNMKYKDKWSPSKGEAKYDEVTYELRLKNTADKSLDSILVEYCIYHQTTIEEEYMVKIYGKEYGHLWVGYPDTLKKYPEQIVSNTVQGTLSFQDIPDGKEPSALTDSLKLISKAEEVTEYLPAPPHKAGDQGTRNTRTIRGKLLGIRCRVYVPTQDGSYAMKEFSNPSTLLKKTKWIAESLSEEESPREEPKKRKEPISEKKETLTNQKDRAALPATPPLEQPVIKHVMEYRAFTTRNGLKMRARPRGFAESTGSLELELVDGTRRAVELQALSQEDQDFIQDWLTGYSLLSNNQIRFTIRKKTDPGKKITGNLTSLNSMFPNMKYKDHWYAAKGGKEYDEITYELRLENKREKTLFGLVVEYCIYHQTTIQEESKNAFYTDSGGRDENGQYYHYEPSWHSSGNDKYKKHPEETVVNTVKGIIVFSNIAVKESEKEHTDPVRIMERSLERTTYPHKPENKTRGTLNRRTVEGKLLGIRYRVYVPTQDGNYAMVEFSNPSSLKSKTEWVAPE